MGGKVGGVSKVWFSPRYLPLVSFLVYIYLFRCVFFSLFTMVEVLLILMSIMSPLLFFVDF